LQVIRNWKKTGRKSPSFASPRDVLATLPRRLHALRRNARPIRPKTHACHCPPTISPIRQSKDSFVKAGGGLGNAA
jgi:hypothetical protein